MSHKWKHVNHFEHVVKLLLFRSLLTSPFHTSYAYGFYYPRTPIITDNYTFWNESTSYHLIPAHFHRLTSLRYSDLGRKHKCIGNSAKRIFQNLCNCFVDVSCSELIGWIAALKYLGYGIHETYLGITSRIGATFRENSIYHAPFLEYNITC